MTCNHCSTVSNEAAKAVGAPEVEATWAENRDHPRFCPTCHGFLRRDGGCTKCDSMSVSSDGKKPVEIELNTLPAEIRRYLTGPIALVAGSHHLPEWLEKAIPQARLMQVQMEVADGEAGDKATIVEACAYLHGVSLTAPLDRDWADIFIHVSAQTMQEYGRISPDGLQRALGTESVKRLSADRQRQLDDLLRRLRQQVSKPRKVSMRNKTLAMAMPPTTNSIEMLLSCGHKKQTSISPGDEEWCTECDEWVTVESSDASPATRTIGFPPAPPWWSFRREQLQGAMDEVAEGKDIAVISYWTGFADSSGKGNGKVYGGFYGRGKDGKWYSVIAYGPTQKAKVKGIQIYDTSDAALRHYDEKKQEKLDNGPYSAHWPCDYNAMPLMRRR